MKEKIKNFYEKHKGEIKTCFAIGAGAIVGVQGFKYGLHLGCERGVAAINMAANQALSENPNMKLIEFSPTVYLETFLNVFEKKSSE